LPLCEVNHHHQKWKGQIEVPHWNYREELSRENKLRRSYYEVLRDQLDQYVIEYSLVASYKRCIEAKEEYPFVEKRELKPRARISFAEYKFQTAFLALFLEDTIPSIHKKYIRFFEDNRTNKKNVLLAKAIPFSYAYDRNLKYLDSARFFSFLEVLLPVDYALLIERDPTTKARNRYALSHFHVRIDWPIADAAEDLARSLRYISKDLYEKGENYAEDLQKKFFEYYGMPVTAGGRRTAAIVAAQFLRKLPHISTVYVSSSETRALIRISERAISKCILMKLTESEMQQLTDANLLSPRSFRKHYLVTMEGTEGVAVFQTTYAHTSHARPPEDGKLRELNPDPYFLIVDGQHILPKPGVWKFSPLPHNVIYS